MIRHWSAEPHHCVPNKCVGLDKQQPESASIEPAERAVLPAVPARRAAKPRKPKKPWG